MKKRVAILHGAGYVGKELIQLILRHAGLDLTSITSRSMGGKDLWEVHPELLGLSRKSFSKDFDPGGVDVVIVAAEHGESMKVVSKIIKDGFQGKIIDMSADFRLRDKNTYEKVYGLNHSASKLNDSFVYGLTEINRSKIADSQFVGNPGCFATAISLALFPLAKELGKIDPKITALTGASGSGAKPSSITHFPTREGNVRAYKILEHRHQAEVNQVLGNDNKVAFVPSSGPWVRGIWGNAQLKVGNLDAETLFNDIYSNDPLVRVHANVLPEMRWSINTPFADIGWVKNGDDLVVGFAIDNLMKGAASQAIQNLNLMCGLDERTGLIPF